MPLEQPNSDQQLTGSTFFGYPAVAGGIYYGSGSQGSLPAYVTSLQTDASGSLFVTASSAFRTWNGGIQGVSASIPLQVWNKSSVGVTGSIATPVPVMITSNSLGVFVLQASVPKSTDNALEVVQATFAQASYSAASGPFQVVASPTDVFQLAGSSTKTIKVHQAAVSLVNSPSGRYNFAWYFRTSADTTGDNSIVAGRYDQNDAAATAAANFFIANPGSLGTQAGGSLRNDVVNVASGSSVQLPLAWTFGRPPFAKPVVLRGAAQCLCLNMSSSVGAAMPIINVTVEWTEES